MTHPRLRDALVLAALVAVAVGVRLPKYAARPFWFDEVYQVHMASAPDLAGVLARVVTDDRNPPASHLLTRAGLAVSADEVGARLPSLAFGVLCVPLAWAAGRAWGDRAAGWWMAAFAAAAPAYVFYSREARAYAPGLAAVFGLIAALGWFRARPGALTGAVLAAAAACAASVQYAGAAVTAVWLLAALLAPPAAPADRAAFRRGWVAAGAVAAAAVAAWVCWFLLPQVRLRGTGTTDAEFAAYFWEPTSPAAGLVFFGRNVADLVAFAFLGGKTGPRWEAAALIAALPALVPLVGSWRSGDPRARTVAAAAVGSVALFVALAGAGKHPFGGTRHCLPLTPGLFLLVALGLSWIGARARPAAVALGLAGLALMGYGTVHTGFHKHDHGVTDLAAAVAAAGRADDPVVVAGGAVSSFRYYEPRLPWAGRVVYCGPNLGDPPDHELAPTLAALLRDRGRAWVVEFDPFEWSAVPVPGATAAQVLDRPRARATLWVAAPGGAAP